ncbi:MAG: glycosyltransferase [Bacillota bacterium]
MRISVIIPTFRRPGELSVCLRGLENQLRRPDEVVVVVRDTDIVTREWLACYEGGDMPVRTVNVTAPGVIAALKAGAGAARGDVLAVTDDDAEPLPNWLKDMEKHYRDPGVGGVGGRDLIIRNGVPSGRCVEPVGAVSWYGRITGNHHWGCGAARDVDVLKGVNMSFRRHLFVLDDSLLGSGAQMYFEVDLCLRVRNLGWRLIYDPGLVVRHYPARRFDLDKRDEVNPASTYNNAHNETYALLKNLSASGRQVFLWYTFLVGTRANPGVAATPWVLGRYGLAGGWDLVRASFRGKRAGAGLYRQLRHRGRA